MNYLNSLLVEGRAEADTSVRTRDTASLGVWYYYPWWGLLVVFLQAHLYHLEEGYSKDCSKCVARPLDQKIKTFSSK